MEWLNFWKERRKKPCIFSPHHQDILPLPINGVRSEGGTEMIAGHRDNLSGLEKVQFRVYKEDEQILLRAPQADSTMRARTNYEKVKPNIA